MLKPYKTKDPIPLINRALLTRLFSKIEVNAKTQCWEWTAYVSKVTGYAQVGMKNSTYLAHRVFYTLFVRQIPDGLIIDHLCRNKKCVNP